MNCRLSLFAISCPHVSSILSQPKPLIKRGTHRISRSGEKETESTSQFYHLPIARAWSCDLLGRDSRDTMGLHFAEHHQSGASQSTAPGWAPHNYSESAPSNTCLWFCSVRNHCITLWVSLSHYFCTRSQKTLLTICCSEK